MTRIYLSPPDIRPLERQMVLDAIDSGWVSPAGPDLARFEAEVAEVTGTKHAVALSSGTAGLHLALLELGVGPGDFVLVSTFTFAATANAVAYVGATPVFIDADAETWQLDPELLAAELEARAAAGTLPKAAIVVDLYGQCADYARIVPLLDLYGVVLIEDAAEAVGATFTGRNAGSFGHCGVISFNGNKLITSGGGGMLVTDDALLAARVRHLSTQAREPVAHYEHIEIGYNYRLSNMLAAFGRGQLASLTERIARRAEIEQRYRDALAERPGYSFMPVGPDRTVNHWLTVITIDPTLAGHDAEALRVHLEGDDIESRPAWKPMHLQPVFADAPRRTNGVSENVFKTGLCLPSGSSMSDADLDRVAARLMTVTST